MPELEDILKSGGTMKHSEFVSKLNGLLMEYPLKIFAGQCEMEGVLGIKVLEMDESNQKFTLAYSKGCGGYFFLEEDGPWARESTTTDPAPSSLDHELALRSARVEALSLEEPSQNHGIDTLALLMRYGRALEQIADNESGSIGAADWMIDVAKEALGREMPIDEDDEEETPINEIESLAVAMFEASELVRTMGIMDASMTVGYATGKALNIEYSLARTRLALATANLEKAIRNAKREVEEP